MRNYKKTFCLVMMGILLFLLINYLIWRVYTEELLTDMYDGGDLTRVGYIYGSKMLRKNSFDLPRRHLEMNDYIGQKVDMLTIGDCFSIIGGTGKNGFYQDYIASINNFTVINVRPYGSQGDFDYFSPLSTLNLLNNSGYLDIIKPRYVLLESIGRYCIRRFSKSREFPETDSLENVRAFYKEDWAPKPLPKIGFLNTGNFKFIYKNLMYCFSDTAFGGKIYLKTLDRPLFSVKKPRQLLFFHEDVTYIPYFNKNAVARLNDNMNAAADILAKKGIKLVFMPIVDKYDLYSDYIVNNNLPRNPFFHYLRELPKKYIFVDTKAILMDALERGERDMYYADDTHWNGKAGQIIFEQVKFK